MMQRDGQVQGHLAALKKSDVMKTVLRLQGISRPSAISKYEPEEDKKSELSDTDLAFGCSDDDPSDDDMLFERAPQNE
jgi:hypothetical protein